MPALSLSLANSIMMRNALQHILSKEKKKTEPTKPKRKKVRSHS